MKSYIGIMEFLTLSLIESQATQETIHFHHYLLMIKIGQTKLRSEINKITKILFVFNENRSIFLICAKNKQHWDAFFKFFFD